MANRQILRDDRVLFGGYKVPHPLEYHVLVKIQTNSSSTPFMTMQQALDDVKSEFEDIRTSFSVFYFLPDHSSSFLISIFSNNWIDLAVTNKCLLKTSCMLQNKININ